MAPLPKLFRHASVHTRHTSVHIRHASMTVYIQRYMYQKKIVCTYACMFGGQELMAGIKSGNNRFPNNYVNVKRHRDFATTTSTHVNLLILQACGYLR